MLIKKGFVRNARIEAGLTQTKLASKIQVSQAFISKWEKENEVPSDKESAWKEALGLDDNTKLHDLQIFGSAEQVKAWRTFLAKFIRRYSEGGGRTILEKMEAFGCIWVLLDPLFRRDFQMPELPTFNEDGELVCANENDTYFFDEVLNEFLLWHENYCDALREIERSQQIRDEDSLELDAESADYVWANVLTTFARDDWFTACFPKEAVASFQEAIEWNEKAIADAWYKSYMEAQTSSAEIKFPPMWKASALVEAASSDISAMFDFDFRKAILKGDPIDPWEKELKTQVKLLLEMNVELHKKVDALAKMVAGAT